MNDDKYRDLYHGALRARAEDLVSLLRLADNWQDMARGLAHDHEGAEYQLGAASAMRDCAERLRAALKKAGR